MPQSALPLISEHDYPAFQRIIPELRQVSYPEWADEHKKAIAYRRSRNGSSEIAISPQEFDLWLKENNTAAHLELLWACVEDKAKLAPEAATP